VENRPLELHLQCIFEFKMYFSMNVSRCSSVAEISFDATWLSTFLPVHPIHHISDRCSPFQDFLTQELHSDMMCGNIWRSRLACYVAEHYAILNKTVCDSLGSG